MEFTACKHLDFGDNYMAKKQVLGNGKVFWLRDIDRNMPAMVQFCKLRGRMNSPEACTEKKFAMCSDYDEITHHVSNESIAP